MWTKNLQSLNAKSTQSNESRKQLSQENVTKKKSKGSFEAILQTASRVYIAGHRNDPEPRRAIITRKKGDYCKDDDAGKCFRTKDGGG